MLHSRLRSFVALSLAALLTVSSASATWSIVVVNTRTREVCVASATCIPNFNLRRWLPVVRVGQGAGAAQSAVDINGNNREIMWDGFQAGLTPQEILDILAQSSSHQSRQYGIASFAGPAVSFTGSGAGLAATGVTGTVDDLVYAVQGNVLTDDSVVFAAEAALRNTVGDLSQRVMAGMEAARALGGDGRCSCSQSAPTSCGAPPPGFTKSAHTAFIVLARLGDTDGPCNSSLGCADGEYFLRRQFNGGVNDIDPVLELATRVGNWRAALSGIADQQLSVVQAGVQELQADGLSSTFVTVRLVDIDGVPLPAGGHTLSIEPQHTGPEPVLVGPVSDQGDGTYEFELTATTTVGRTAFHITVDDGQGSEVLLWPPLSVNVVAPTDFHTSHFDVSASEGAQVRSIITHPLGAAGTGLSYTVLASLAGTTPGTNLGGVFVPLNQDRLFDITSMGRAQPPVFEDFMGAFGPNGRGQAKFFVSPEIGSVLVGTRVDLLAIYDDGQGGLAVTTGDHFEVLP